MASGSCDGSSRKANRIPSGKATLVSTEQLLMPRKLVTGDETTKPSGVEPVVTKPPLMISSNDAQMTGVDQRNETAGFELEVAALEIVERAERLRDLPQHSAEGIEAQDREAGEIGGQARAIRPLDQRRPFRRAGDSEIENVHVDQSSLCFVQTQDEVFAGYGHTDILSQWVEEGEMV